VSFHKDFGLELYGKVVAGELKSFLQKELQESKDGVRLSLQFAKGAQTLSDLPWEFLHDGEDFLVARPKILLSRLPSGSDLIQSAPLETILRMLVVISAPSGPGCAPLDTEKERDRIMQAVDRLYAQRKLEVDFTDDATFETIQSYLNEKDYHIVHFTGHGVEKDGQGFLALENDDLSLSLADNQAVADLFADRGVRLVVLSACQSDDLARRLAARGVPAALAMQYSIHDSSATRFAFSFYQALAAGRAVDRSLTEARLAMRNAEGGNNVDFATPVLYLLDPDCLRIDRIKPAPEEMFDKPFMLGELQVMKEGFVGRQKELRLLSKALLSGVKRAAIIHGWGGIGKTVLASRLALRLDQHFEGVYGQKCHPQTRAEDILNGLNAFLIMAGISAFNQVLYSPAPMAAKTSVLTSILNQKRFLIILDNFESCLDQSHQQIADQELRQMIEALLNATASNTKFIITTRYDFDPLQGRLMNAIERLSVPEMPLYQAVWLMNNFTNLAALSYEKKKEIHTAIGGHPWTIGMFVHHATTATVDGLLLELGPLEQELRDFTLFDKSYSELDSQARDLLVSASVLEESVPEEALRWMIGDDEEPSPAVDKPLGMLLAWGLMSSQEEQGRMMYLVHTKVRDFAGRDAKVDRRGLQVRAAQYYEMRVKENSNIWDHLRARDYYYRADEWEKAANIVIKAAPHLHRLGHIQLAIGLLQQSADTASVATKALAKGNLATFYKDVGDWRTALRLYGEVKTIFEAQGDRKNVAVTLHQLGNVHFDLGNYPEAVNLYQQSLQIHKELDNRFGIAATLHQLGYVHYQQGDYPEAVNLYKQSLQIHKELGDRSGIGKTLHQLGMIRQDQGNYPEAVKLYEQSLEIKKDLGDKSGIAHSLHQLGMIHQDQGNYPEAVKLYEQSLDISRELGDRFGIALSLHQMGSIKDEGKDFGAL
jgi:tetratricopeptide (TPR) repeat protein